MDLSTRDGRRQQGELIKRAAREAGMTSEELAQRVGCSRSLIYQYISGASLAQTDRLQQIAAETGKPLNWFFRGQSDEPAASAQPILANEREALDEQRRLLAAERARLEERWLQESEAHLRAIIDANASPPDWRRVAEGCQQLGALLERGDRAAELGEVLLRQGNALIQLQEWGSAKEKLERAGTLFRQSGRPDRALSCMQSLGQVNMMLGRADEALQQFLQVAGGSDWWSRWQGALSAGAAHEYMGDYASASELFSRAMQVVDERDEGPDTAFAQLYVESNWANVELDCGDLASALERASRCVRLAQRHGVQDQYVEALLTRGMALLAMGDVRQAMASLHQGLDVADLTKDHHRWSMALACISLCRSACLQTAAAIADGKEALTIALRSGASRSEIAAQRALAAAYLTSPRSRRVPIEPDAPGHVSRRTAGALTGGPGAPVAELRGERGRTSGRLPRLPGPASAPGAIHPCLPLPSSHAAPHWPRRPPAPRLTRGAASPTHRPGTGTPRSASTPGSGSIAPSAPTCCGWKPTGGAWSVPRDSGTPPTCGITSCWPSGTGSEPS
jgi:tetratricopeptide (TPR) repeat protein